MWKITMFVLALTAALAKDSIVIVTPREYMIGYTDTLLFWLRKWLPNILHNSNLRSTHSIISSHWRSLRLNWLRSLRNWESSKTESALSLLSQLSYPSSKGYQLPIRSQSKWSKAFCKNQGTPCSTLRNHKATQECCTALAEEQTT